MLDQALGWIGAIAEKIGQFLPHWIILDTTIGGVKYRALKRHGWRFHRELNTVAVGPGLVLWWPIFCKLQTFPTARQGCTLRVQNLTTADDVTIQLKALVVFCVEDVLALLTTTWEPDETIEEIALGVFGRIVAGHTWKDLKDSYRSGVLDRNVRRQIGESLKSYGVKVLFTRFVYFVKDPYVVSLSGGTSMKLPGEAQTND